VFITALITETGGDGGGSGGGVSVSPEAPSGLQNVALLEVVTPAFPMTIALKCLKTVVGSAVTELF